MSDLDIAVLVKLTKDCNCDGCKYFRKVVAELIQEYLVKKI